MRSTIAELAPPGMMPRVADRIFVDTNILLYSISDAPAEAGKQAIAVEILAGANCVLSAQVLQEFFAQATRSTKAHPLPADIAWTMMTAWRRFPVQQTDGDVLDGAYALHRDHRFAWWDSLIVAAAQAQGCRLLYTEDMQHGRIVGGLRIVNPFS